MSATASLPEIVYVAMALLGQGLVLWIAWDNRADWRVAQAMEDGEEVRSTVIVMVLFAFVVGILDLGFLVLGLFALATPPPRPERAALTLVFQIGYIAMLTAANGALLTAQVLRLRLRNRR